MYEVRLLESAAADLKRLDTETARRVVARIRRLAERMPSSQLEALKGHLAGLYKLREGDYRIIFQALKNEDTILVHAIGHRREIYRKR